MNRALALLLSVVILPQTFRRATDLVTADVVVLRDGRPVVGLKAPDFALLDNGVAQDISVVPTSDQKLDLSLLVDTSVSVEPALLKTFTDASRQLLATSASGNLQLLTFSNKIDLYADGSALDRPRLSADGATALYDAISAATIATGASTNRHLVVAFTDGQDTLSFFDASTAERVAGFGDSVVTIVLDRTSATAVPKRLRDLTEATGGEVLVLDVRRSGVDALRRIVDRFRSGYVLSYSPKGVELRGQHHITVQVARPGKYEVRSKKSYVWSQGLP